MLQPIPMNRSTGFGKGYLRQRRTKWEANTGFFHPAKHVFCRYAKCSLFSKSNNQTKKPQASFSNTVFSKLGEKLHDFIKVAWESVNFVPFQSLKNCQADSLINQTSKDASTAKHSKIKVTILPALGWRIKGVQTHAKQPQIVVRIMDLDMIGRIVRLHTGRSGMSIRTPYQRSYSARHTSTTLSDLLCLVLMWLDFLVIIWQADSMMCVVALQHAIFIQRGQTTACDWFGCVHRAKTAGKLSAYWVIRGLGAPISSSWYDCKLWSCPRFLPALTFNICIKFINSTPRAISACRQR